VSPNLLGDTVKLYSPRQPETQ